MRSILDTVKSRYDRTMSERTKLLDPDVRRELADEVEAALNMGGGGDGGSAADDDGRPTAEEIDAAVVEVEDALVVARNKLQELERSEQFVGVRCRRYRLALEDRAAELEKLAGATEAGEDVPPSNEEATSNTSTSNTDNEEEEDVEGGSDPQYSTSAPIKPPKSAEELAEMREKQAKDEEALDKVIDTHRTMLANVERMRRRIADLERKREEISTGRDMCRDFLLAAAEAEELEAAGELQRGACPITPETRAGIMPGGTEGSTATEATAASVEGQGSDNEDPHS